MTAPLLQIEALKAHFALDEGTVKAVDGASVTVDDRQTVGLVGESGCGKSILAHAILGLVPKPGRIVGGKVVLHKNGAAVDLAALPTNGREIRRIRGREISMVFQEPMASLSMYHTVGRQIGEAIQLHFKTGRTETRERVITLLRKVALPHPEAAVDAYPFELSGGMRQRVMIAQSLACEPRLLIADEPTTALDVTTQAQILDLLRQLRDDTGMAILMITHDLGVVAEMCQRVAVMYLGSVVENAPVEVLFDDPLHPYTRALIRSVPRIGQSKDAELRPISGSIPDPYSRPSGCPFHNRCPEKIEGLCDAVVPARTDFPNGRSVVCHLHGGAQ